MEEQKEVDVELPHNAENPPTEQLPSVAATELPNTSQANNETGCLEITARGYVYYFFVITVITIIILVACSCRLSGHFLLHSNADVLHSKRHPTNIGSIFIHWNYNRRTHSHLATRC